MPTLLLRRPAKSMADGIVTHIADSRGSFDHDEALQQHEAYAHVFRRHGWDDVIYVDDADDLPDSVFVEDGVVSVQRLGGKSPESEGKDGIFILASPGAEQRKREVEGIERALQAGSTRPLYRIVLPGTLDGGDVLKVPALGVIYIGDSARTNHEGRKQFAEHVEPLGWKVVSVPVKKALHLKSILTALPDGTVIGYEQFIEDTSIFDRFVAMPELEGVAVVFLDPAGQSNSPLIMSSAAPKSAAILRNQGYTVLTTDISHFEKLEGCVTCLSVRVR